MLRRVGTSEAYMLDVQSNLAMTYQMLGRTEEALRLEQDVYSGFVKLLGEEHANTLRVANNYAGTLRDQRRYEEAKALLRKTIPVAQRVLGSNEITLKMRWTFGMSLTRSDAATLDDLREAVTTLEDAERTTRRVFGGTHPVAVAIKANLQSARAVLRADLSVREHFRERLNAA